MFLMTKRCGGSLSGCVTTSPLPTSTCRTTRSRIGARVRYASAWARILSLPICPCAITTCTRKAASSWAARCRPTLRSSNSTSASTASVKRADVTCLKVSNPMARSSSSTYLATGWLMIRGRVRQCACSPPCCASTRRSTRWMCRPTRWGPRRVLSCVTRSRRTSRSPHSISASTRSHPMLPAPSASSCAAMSCRASPHVLLACQTRARRARTAPSKSAEAPALEPCVFTHNLWSKSHGHVLCSTHTHTYTTRIVFESTHATTMPASCHQPRSGRQESQRLQYELAV
mmetsp:Transcript_6204/g.9876  ORF Transcript_6204/g.9876 Transcript_6204/m.9876 type:complete len:287 (+) Transcript_6204:689-1549(+)